MRRLRDIRHVLWLACAAAVVALCVASPLAAANDAEGAQAWRSAFERRSQPDLRDRFVVVLAAPSLADEATRAGGIPGEKAQRRIARRAEALQRRLLAALKRQGVSVRREHVFTLTFNGFSAVLDAKALAVLGRAPGVAGVYPVRAVFPASVTAELAPGAGELSSAEVPPVGIDAGVTVALLDTGVDAGHPALAGRVLAGIDLVPRSVGAPADAHGTRMAGIVASEAPSARILPIRVLGKAVGRSDVLLAGLERAVDPDGDGDVGDAARVALVPLVEPYAGFADSPEARAVAGALALGTLVVAAAGNDGPAGQGFGTVGAPASAPAALAVGAADLREQLPATAVRILVGEEIVFDGVARLLGNVAPTASTTGGAVLVAADGTPLEPKVRAAKETGASVVLVHGSVLPAGALELGEDVAIPVVAIPADVGQSLAAVGPGSAVSVVFGPAPVAPNPGAGGVAPFSSRGLAFDGRVKPDLVASGVGVATADGGVSPDGSARYASVTGSSAAAAVAAGAAALVAAARPDLDASKLRAALVGSARPLEQASVPEPVSGQGSGLLDPAAAMAAELVVEPATLAFGRAREDPWEVAQTVRVTNTGDETRFVHFEIVRQSGDGALLAFSADPAELELAPGAAADVRIVVSSGASPERPSAASGWFLAVTDDGQSSRLPWTISFPDATPRLIANVKLSARSFSASKTQPAVLSFQAGFASESGDGVVIEPVSVLDVELWKPGGKRLGTLLRLRDLLPGRYALGLTGRDALGRLLPPGRYVVKLRARSVDLAEGRAGATTVARISFTLRAPA